MTDVAIKLSDIRAEWDKYLVLKDPYIIDMVFGTVIGNMLLDRDPVWLMIVGPSSSGKTTLVAPLSGIKSCFFIDDMTEKTLLSGFKGVKGKETSLLKTIGSGILVFSDFTSILTKNPTSRGEILTQLKLVFDRKLTKYTGTGVQEWQGKIGFIGCSTPDIYAYLEQGRSLGERFIYYWLDSAGDAEIADKQKHVKISAKETSERLGTLYSSYFRSIIQWTEANGVPELKMSDAQRNEIKQASIFCVNGKATIHTDFKTGKADALPNRAGIGRDVKMFETVLHALQLMNAYETNDPQAPVTDEMVKIVQKCAYSSINRERRMILEILNANDMPLTASQIGATKGFGLPKESVEKYLVPLNAVGLIRKQAESNRHRWFIDDKDREIKDFITTVMGPSLDLVSPPDEDEEAIRASETQAEADWKQVG